MKFAQRYKHVGKKFRTDCEKKIKLGTFENVWKIEQTDSVKHKKAKQPIVVVVHLKAY